MIILKNFKNLPKNVYEKIFKKHRKETIVNIEVEEEIAVDPQEAVNAEDMNR